MGVFAQHRTSRLDQDPRAVVRAVQNTAHLRAAVRHGVEALFNIREYLFEDGSRALNRQAGVGTSARLRLVQVQLHPALPRRPEAAPSFAPAVGRTNQSPANAAMTRLCTRFVSTPRPASARNF